uniref:Putative phospholipase a2 n=1 Tax=Rhipicephalus pulchellus TaxID=72859 RepID=L7LXT1_RHIPC
MRARKAIMPAFAAPFIMCLCVMSHLLAGINGIPKILKTSEKPRIAPGKSTNVGGAGAEENVTTIESVTRIHFICTDAYSGGHRLAEVFKNSAGGIISCNMVGDSKLIKRVLSFIPIYITDRVSKKKMDQISQQCSGHPQNFEASFFAQLLDKRYQGIAAFPGTKWCGSGNVARNYEDLGEARDTDKCCREHDFAMDSIPPNKTRHGLQNKLTYTMTNCKYDKKFFKCLTKATSLASLSVGVSFFDVLKTKCYRFGRPTKCADKNSSRAKQPNHLCRKFKKDIRKPRQWRIYNPPNFFTAYFQAKGRRNILNELWTSE